MKIEEDSLNKHAFDPLKCDDPVDRLRYRMARQQAKALGAQYHDCLSELVDFLMSDQEDSWQ